jgi:hypothetical protein
MTAPTESAFNTVLASLMLALQRRRDVRIEVEAIAGSQRRTSAFGDALTALRYRPECLGHRPNGISILHPSQIFTQCHIAGLIRWSDANVLSRLGAHHDHRQLDIK